MALVIKFEMHLVYGTIPAKYTSVLSNVKKVKDCLLCVILIPLFLCLSIYFIICSSHRLANYYIGYKQGIEPKM